VFFARGQRTERPDPVIGSGIRGSLLATFGSGIGKDTEQRQPTASVASVTLVGCNSVDTDDVAGEEVHGMQVAQPGDPAHPRC
jgi:hypothetical protein